MTDKPAAHRLPGQRFEFNKAAKQAVKDYPQLAGNTVFIDLTTGERTGTLKARIRTRLSKKFGEYVKQAGDKAAKATHRGDAHAVHHNGLHGIAMTTDRTYGVVAGKKTTQEMDGLFAFHHELGHLVVPAGKSGLGKYFDTLFGVSPARAEIAADAYAVIRHLQQYGKDSGPINHAPIRRAMDVIHHDTPEYLTSFVIDALLRDKDKIVAASLTPAQVVEEVEKYTARYAPSKEQAEALQKDFAPLKGALYKVSKTNLEPFKKLAEITLNPASSPLTFYIGNRILGAFLGPTLFGAEWQEVAKKLRAKEQTMTLDTLFPVKPPAPEKLKPSAKAA